MSVFISALQSHFWLVKQRGSSHSLMYKFCKNNYTLYAVTQLVQPTLCLLIVHYHINWYIITVITIYKWYRHNHTFTHILAQLWYTRLEHSHTGSCTENNTPQTIKCASVDTANKKLVPLVPWNICRYKPTFVCNYNLWRTVIHLWNLWPRNSAFHLQNDNFVISPGPYTSLLHNLGTKQDFQV